MTDIAPPHRTTITSLPPSAGFWNKFKSKGKEPEPKQPAMAVARPKLLTLAMGDMETLRMVRTLSFYILARLGD